MSAAKKNLSVPIIILQAENNVLPLTLRHPRLFVPSLPRSGSRQWFCGALHMTLLRLSPLHDYAPPLILIPPPPLWNDLADCATKAYGATLEKDSRKITTSCNWKEFTLIGMLPPAPGDFPLFLPTDPHIAFPPFPETTLPITVVASCPYFRFSFFIV